jgi:hypothetical protein
MAAGTRIPGEARSVSLKGITEPMEVVEVGWR